MTRLIAVTTLQLQLQPSILCLAAQSPLILRRSLSDIAYGMNIIDDQKGLCVSSQRSQDKYACMDFLDLQYRSPHHSDQAPLLDVRAHNARRTIWQEPDRWRRTWARTDQAHFPTVIKLSKNHQRYLDQVCLPQGSERPDGRDWPLNEFYRYIVALHDVRARICSVSGKLAPFGLLQDAAVQGFGFQEALIVLAVVKFSIITNNLSINPYPKRF